SGESPQASDFPQGSARLIERGGSAGAAVALRAFLSCHGVFRGLALASPPESTLTVNADALRSRMRNTSLPSANSSPGVRRVGAEMRVPLTWVPFVLSRSSIVAVPWATVMRAWRRETVVPSMTSEQSASRPATCSPSGSGKDCFIHSTSIVAGAERVSGKLVTWAQNAYPVLYA